MKKQKSVWSLLLSVMLVCTLMFAGVPFSAVCAAETEETQEQVLPSKLKLDLTKLTLVKDQAKTLQVTVSPSAAQDTKLTWKSSNPSVLRVNSAGKVRALRGGTAYVTVSSVNGKKARCKVTVLEPTKVKLNKTALTLTKTQSYTLTSKVYPTSAQEAAVYWRSSNEKVAKVTSKGKVVAVGSGTATIRAFTKNKVEAVCKVTVLAPSKVKLNKTTASVLPGQSFTLKATISPSSAKAAKVYWKSSNKKVATVSTKGKVKVVGAGKAVITAYTKNGKKATCAVTSKAYTQSGKKLKVGSPAGTRTYTMYTQLEWNSSYYRNHGCITTAVSIAASAFGKNFSPYDIHAGSESSYYSERYAVKQMGASAASYGSCAISVRLASQILTDMGIKNVPVYTYSKPAAIAQIKAHLAKGKPVIVKAHNQRYNGVQIANGHHAMVLVGIDENGYGIFIEPFNGRLNYAHGNGTYFKRTVDQFVNGHMSPATGNYSGPYVYGLSTAGGYILVG